MALLNSLSPFWLSLTVVLLGCVSYALGGAIGFYSANYSDGDTKQWLEQNKSDLSACFYDSQKAILLQRSIDKSIDCHVRMHVYRLVSFFILFALLALSPNASFFLVLSVIFSTLLWLSSVDIDSQTVPEKPLYAMTLVQLGFFALLPNARWVNAEGIMVGTFLILVVISVSIFFTKRLRNKDQPAVLFGDGDILVLIALALYFGVDTLIVLGVASALFVGANLFKPFYFTLLKKTGHHPVDMETNGGMAFLPFIFLGLFLTVSSTLIGWVEFSPSVEQLHEWFVLSLSLLTYGF